MDLKDYITNEKVSKKFSSQFELVNYAIKLAANMIETGRDSRVKTDSQNRANQILCEILNNKDKFDEVIIYESPSEDRYSKYEDSAPTKNVERKKSRKTLAE